MSKLTGDTEKPQGYLQIYEEAFSPLLDKEVRLLELGIHKGGSLLMWRDYFSRGIIVGLDLNSVQIDDPTGRIRVYQGNQDDTRLLSKIAKEQTEEGFDVIIDDCAHIGRIAHTSFHHLFNNHLKPGGIYAVEDWGTGYWGTHEMYPDGRYYQLPVIDGPRIVSHDYGMVGFVKELIDEVGTPDITHPTWGKGPPHQSPRSNRIEITPGLVLVFKAK